MSDASGSMKVSLVAEENPFSMAMLLSQECFILDNGAARKIFVWKGRRSLALHIQKLCRDTSGADITPLGH